MTPSEGEGAAREHLARSLAAYTPANEHEGAHRDRIRALVRDVPRCFWRGTYAPGHVTGSAFIVCRATRAVLLHHHRKLDRWLQMGGHDDGEHDPVATAAREAREESGLVDLALLQPGILDLDVHAIPASSARTSSTGEIKAGEPAHEHHDVRFAFVTSAPDAIARDDIESKALAWFSLEEADRRMGEVGSTRALSKIAALL